MKKNRKSFFVCGMASEMELVKKLRDELGAGFMACKKALTEANGDYDKAYDILRKQGASKALSKADRVANEGLCGYLMNDTGIVVVKLNCETDFVAKNEKFQALLETILGIALKNKSSSVDELLSTSDNGKNVKEIITEGVASIGENIVLSDVVYNSIGDDKSASVYVHNKAEGKDNMGRIITITFASGVNDNDNAKLLLKQIDMHITAMSPIALEEGSIDSSVIEREKAIYEEQVAKLNKPADIAKKMVEGKLRKFYEESVLLKQTFVMDNKSSVADVVAKFNKDNNASLELLSFNRVAI